MIGRSASRVGARKAGCPSHDTVGATNMSRSILDAIKLGVWDFEPSPMSPEQYGATAAEPGSLEKLDVLAERLAQGKPLWHPEDRLWPVSDRRMEA